VQAAPSSTKKAAPVSVNGGDEIVEMDRMRKLLVIWSSVQTSTCSSLYEVDAPIVKWREKIKIF
jgi:2-oxoglutarate dehydrogenase E2 component (dihydrolipoamide succinyltransferase)